MVLDECLAHPADVKAARQSMERTLRWARRARDRFLAHPRGSRARRRGDQSGPGAVRDRAGQRLSGAARGERAATVAIGFEAYAIGGLSVGEPTDVMYDIVARTTPCLPDDRPRYLMGTGTPGGSGRIGRPGRRPVRLRAADAERAEWPALHERGSPQHQERALRGRRSASGSGLRLLHVPHLLTGLSAASLSGRRDQRLHP